MKHVYCNFNVDTEYLFEHHMQYHITTGNCNWSFTGDFYNLDGCMCCMLSPKQAT